MLEVHAILQRQRCNENMTEKTGTLSDAYFLLIKDYSAFSVFSSSAGASAEVSADASAGVAFTV